MCCVDPCVCLHVFPQTTPRVLVVRFACAVAVHQTYHDGKTLNTFTAPQTKQREHPLLGIFRKLVSHPVVTNANQVTLCNLVLNCLGHARILDKTILAHFFENRLNKLPRVVTSTHIAQSIAH